MGSPPRRPRSVPVPCAVGCGRLSRRAHGGAPHGERRASRDATAARSRPCGAPAVEFRWGGRKRAIEACTSRTHTKAHVQGRICVCCGVVCGDTAALLGVTPPPSVEGLTSGWRSLVAESAGTRGQPCWASARRRPSRSDERLALLVASGFARSLAVSSVRRCTWPPWQPEVEPARGEEGAVDRVHGDLRARGREQHVKPRGRACPPLEERAQSGHGARTDGISRPVHSSRCEPGTSLKRATSGPGSISE